MLIIGAGIAGLYTALHLAGDRRVLLATAGPLESGNTPLAQGGIAAALGPDDSADLHFADTLAAGAGHCDADAVRILVTEGPDCVEDLRRRGIPFGVGPGWQLTREAAHSRRRVAFVADRTGLAVHRGLTGHVLADNRLTVASGCRLTQLLTSEGNCVGAVLQKADGTRLAVRAAQTVLATGGLGRLYRLTTNSFDATGNGMAIAYEAGAALTDLEFVQFHPTALWHRGRVIALVTEALRGEGAVLRNRHGDRFMPAYDERAELAPRDIVARAVQAQMEADGAPHVWLDARHLGASVRTRFPAVTAACAAVGIDPAQDMIPIVPAAHYSMGGIYTDCDGLTTLPGLLAVGEAACTGVHGANRLASNSLLEGLVFGRRAARWLAGASVPKLDPLPALPKLAPPPTVPLRGRTHSGISDEPSVNGPDRWPVDVPQVMWNYAGLVRSGDGLRRAEQILTRAAEILTQTADLQTQAERRLAGADAPAASVPRRQLTLARLIVKAALQRTESRGAHFRSDCPAPVSDWAGRRMFHRIESRREVTV